MAQLFADDDPAVHEGTRFALYDYNLNGQGIELLACEAHFERSVVGVQGSGALQGGQVIVV